VMKGVLGMADQELRDRSGRLIGRIKQSGGKYEGRDASGRLKGTYNPSNNETRDSSGRLVGHGNLLATLITQM